MLNEAVVLAGGLATRLAGISHDTPKSLLPVGGRPFLDHLVWNVRRHGIERVVFAVGRHAEQIVEHIGDGAAFGIDPVFSVEDVPLGTGGALALAATHVRGDEALVLNGDTIFDLNYLDLALLRRSAGLSGAIALRRVPDAARYGSVVTDGERVFGFAEKVESGVGLVSGGAYVLAREALDRLPAGPSSIEYGLLPELARAGKLAGREYEGEFIDIGIPSTYEAAQRIVPAWRHRPAVFLDRDGVLNVDTGHTHTREEFEWMPGARAAVKVANDRGYLVIVVTNQSGIGRGLYSQAEFEEFMRWIGERLAEIGAHLDAVYFCPHHPTEAVGEHLRECDCRKPAPGMLVRAIRDWDVDVAGSVMIGDSAGDMQAAAAAGVRGVIYDGGDLRETLARALAEGAG